MFVSCRRMVLTSLRSFTGRRPGIVRMAFPRAIAFSITGTVGKGGANTRVHGLFNSVLSEQRFDEHEPQEEKHDTAVKDAYSTHPQSAREKVFCRPIERCSNHSKPVSFRSQQTETFDRSPTTVQNRAPSGTLVTLAGRAALLGVVDMMSSAASAATAATICEAPQCSEIA